LKILKIGLLMKLKINDIFYSLQGEGARAGTANIFIRLANCNLECKFCDTEFHSFKEYTIAELLDFIKQFNCKNIIWTGGEPTLQLTNQITFIFNSKGFYQAIETNGSNPVPEYIDYIACSPKVAEHVLRKKLKFANELRYVRNKMQQLPKPMIKADYYYISPEFSGNDMNLENINHCINLIKENPEWRLSIQWHKLINIA